MLRKRFGQGIQIDMVSGTDFPEDLTPYDLIIHCGACMFNRKYVLNRIEAARKQQVPMTNYGVTIACLQGITGQKSIIDEKKQALLLLSSTIKPTFVMLKKNPCGSSSVGRASASQAEGHGFESRLPLIPYKSTISNSICIFFKSPF